MPENHSHNRSTQVWKDVLFFLLDVALNVAIIVGLAMIIRLYVMTPFRVYGQSMCNTLNYIDGQCVRGNGEYIIVNKILYRKFGDFSLSAPKRGDIVVFRPPLSEGEFYIKRVIGLPGEKVELRGGYLYIYNEEHPDGFQLNESYLNAFNAGNTYVYDGDVMVFDVPQGSYFLLGDNRAASSDSRTCFSEMRCTPFDSPFLPFDRIEGKAWISLWPFDTIRVL